MKLKVTVLILLCSSQISFAQKPKNRKDLNEQIKYMVQLMEAEDKEGLKYFELTDDQIAEIYSGCLKGKYMNESICQQDKKWVEQDRDGFMLSAPMAASFFEHCKEHKDKPFTIEKIEKKTYGFESEYAKYKLTVTLKNGSKETFLKFKRVVLVNGKWLFASDVALEQY